MEKNLGLKTRRQMYFSGEKELGLKEHGQRSMAKEHDDHVLAESKQLNFRIASSKLD